MAIGNYYPVSRNVTDDDLFLGTRAGSNNTVNYMAQTVVDYLNTNAKISIGGQLSFKFTIIPSVPKTIAFNGGGGDNTAFSAITQLIVSAVDASDSNVTVFLNYLDGNEILLSQQNEPNMFGHYKITSYSVIGTSQFYTLNLQFIGGNGNIEKDIYYDLNPFALSSSIGAVPTLQQVTDQGNTTNNSITIDDGSGYAVNVAPSGIQLGSLSTHGGFNSLYGISLVDDITTEQFILDLDGLLLKTVSGGNGGRIKADLLTSTVKTYQLPNASGTFALTSDIPVVTTPTLNQVLTAGNTSLLNAKIGVLYGYDTNSSDYGTMEFYDTGVVIKGATTNHLLFYNDDTGSVRFSNGAYTPTLNFAGVGNNIYTFQNANGTLAFLSDIPSLAGYVPTSRTLTINGTTYDLSANRTWNVGTVTSVTATGPITSTGGTTPVISTLMHTDRLIGRTTAGTGTMEEISVGAGLTLSAGTLSATSTGGSIPHAIATGTDTYAATVASVTSYTDGDAYLIRFTNANTTVSTLNINSLGAIPLYRNNDGQILGGDIWAGGEMLCVYNSGTNAFQCIGTSPNSLFAYVTNADSVAITKGQPVFAFGGTGDRMTVKRAYNTSDATSAQTVGVVVTSSIAVNQKGIIIVQGLLDGLSILPTASWADGDPIYLGATPGSITNVKQYAPNHLVYLGVVTSASNGSAGRWYVRVQNGYELDELHNVQAQTPSVNDILYYFGGSPGQWKTASIPTVLGYTPVTSARTISTTSPLQGGGDLTADRTLSILQSSSSQNGYLSSTDWTTFNSKQNTITLTTTGTSGPATLVGATLNIPQYSGGGGGSTPVKLTSQTLTVGSWTLVGSYYTYAFSNVNITTTCDVSVTPQNASYLTAYNAQVLPFVGVAAGVATFYSQFPPQDNMVVDIVITQTT